MKNFRNKAIAALAAVAIIGTGAFAAPTEAHAGKRDIAKALIGGLVVGAIIGATANNNQPRVVVQDNGPDFRGQRPHRAVRATTSTMAASFPATASMPVQSSRRTFVNVRPQRCFTREEVTVDQWGNRASSISQVCN
ncbi:MAG: hypothetical protein R3D34_02855 [Nitratireductor sp.]